MGNKYLEGQLNINSGRTDLCPLHMIEETSYANPTDFLIFQFKGLSGLGEGYWGNLRNYALTQDRNWYLPDASGTLALTSDIPAPITNYVTTNTTQTITGNKTFSGSINASSLYGGYVDITVSDSSNLTFSLDQSEENFPFMYANATVYSADFTLDVLTANRSYVIPDKSGTFAMTSDVPTVTSSVTQGSTDVVTSGGVYTAINNLPKPMIYKGTLGTGGTITSLPTASASNEGYTYKVITDGTYASQSAKVGDVFISNGSVWTLIPAGDDVEDTWRNIKVNDTELLGTGISTGAVNFKNGTNVTITGSGNDITIASTYTNYYPTTFSWTNGTTSGPTGSLTGNSGFTAVSFGAIPAASDTQSGIVTTDDQTLAGTKTLLGQYNSEEDDIFQTTTINGEKVENFLSNSSSLVAQTVRRYATISGAFSPNGDSAKVPALMVSSTNKNITLNKWSGFTTYYTPTSIYKVLNSGASDTIYNLIIPSANGTIALTSDFSASTTGTATTEAKYITINGTEWKLGGGSVNDVQVNNVSVLSSGVANIPLADASTAGVVSAGAQTFGGAKTFGDSYGSVELGATGNDAIPVKIWYDDNNTSTFLQICENYQTATYLNLQFASDSEGGTSTITFPKATGTIALIDDLPQVIDLRS